MRLLERAASPGAARAATSRPHVLGPRRAPYIFIAPFFLLYGAFWLYPVLYSFWLSFHHWTARATVPVGVNNYARIGQDPEVQTSFANAIWYLVVNNALQLTLALAIALLLDAAFLRYELSRLVVTVFAYLLVVAGQ